MADISSLYPQPAPPVNPLSTISTLQGLQAQQQAMQLQANQNALFQQEFSAKKALGGAYSQAIDPDTGQLDTNKLMTFIGQPGNPAGILGGQLAGEALTRRQSELDIQTRQQALAQARRLSANTALGALATNPKATPGDALGTMADLYRTGVLDAQTAQQYITTTPSDPAAFKDWLGQLQKQTLSPSERQALITGTPLTTETGAGTNVGYATPGGYNVVATVPKQLSPAELATPQDWPDPNNPKVIIHGTHGQYLQQVGALGGGNPSAPVPTGRYPAPQGTPIAGPAPGAVEASQHTAESNAAQGQALQEQANQAATVLKPAYSQMQADLKDFVPGPTADWTKAAKSLTNTFTPDVLQKMGIRFDPQAIASQEGFTKLANQIALAQGGQSDAHLGIAEGANPSAKLSPLGAKQILGRLQGNNDFIIAKNQAWQDYQKQGNGPENFGQFSTRFNADVDPRIFWMPSMTGSEQKAFVKGLSDAEARRWVRSTQLAKQNGWFQ